MKQKEFFGSNDMPVQSMKILGVRVQRFTYAELLQAMRSSVERQGPCTYAGYFNAHHAVEAWKNEEIRTDLNSLDIVHSDGAGIYLSSRLLYGATGLVEKVNGTDFYPLLLKEAERLHWNIFFLGENESTVEQLRMVIARDYPALLIAGAYHGFFQENDVAVEQMIKDSSPDILFVGMGMQKQLSWIRRRRKAIDASVRVCLLVGGGIEYIARVRPRAPKSMQIIGLEWLFRLLSNPLYYWRRYLIGIPQFCYLIVRQKLRM